MAGVPTRLMTDLNNSQPPAFLTGPGKKRNILNEAQKHTYTFLSRFLNGRGEGDKQVFQDSHRIQLAWMATDVSTAAFYNPGDTIEGQVNDVIDTGEIGWAYLNDKKAWYAQQLEHSRKYSDDAQDAFIIDFKEKLDMQMFTSLMNKIERSLTDVPDGATNYALMEGNGLPAAPKVCYSVFALFSELTGTSNKPNGWTNIHGRAPATDEWWRNPVRTYDYDDPDDSGGDGQGLERAFYAMQEDLKFELPGRKDQYFESPTMSRQFIATSLAGLLQYQQLVSDRNDRTYSKTSLGIPSLDYLGIPLVRCEEMETNTLYDASGTAATEDNALKNGPRYLWLNGNFIFVVFHPDHFFDMRSVREPDNQIDAFFQPVTVWFNLVCTSRRRGGGFITPVA
jgi:hypothetical protein